MAGSEGFVLPHVEEALRPFIKSRQEVASIRQHLQDSFDHRSSRKQTSVPFLNLTNAHPTALETKHPPSSTVQDAYWKALKAHRDAQANYGALKKELDQIKSDKSTGVTRSSTPETTFHVDYLPLMRQRERIRKLKVVERTYVNIVKRGEKRAQSSLDEVVNGQLGNLPPQPGDRIPAPALQDPDLERRMVSLKKAIVTVKAQLDEHSDASIERGDQHNGDFSPQTEVAGLQKALQELTTWMEIQLSTIAAHDGENESSNELKRSCDRSLDHVCDDLTEDAEGLYEDYLAARESLVNSIADLPTKASTSTFHLGDLFEVTADVGHSVTIPTSGPEALLPFISTHIRARQEEHSLLQHSSFIRQLVSASQMAAKSAVRRLADESHMVLPNASKGQEWAAAADGQAAVLRTHVLQRADAGKSDTANALMSIEAIKTIPGSLSGMVEPQ